jgi:hypothetical protein
MQSTQKYVFGVGDWVLAFEVEGQDLIIRPALPHRVWTRTDTVNAARLLELRELRFCKTAPDSEAYEWFWFCWRIDGEPCQWVMDSEGRNCSNLHLLSNGEYAPVDGLSGEAYPYRYKDGAPFIPFQFYSDADTGSLWNLSGRRGARVGALNSIVLSTYNLRAAVSAAVPPIIAINLQKPAGNQRGLMAGTQNGDPSSSDSIPVTPGSILFLQESQDAKSSPSVSMLQGGSNLQALSQYTDGYTQGQLSRLGLAGDQVQRNTSNPTSAGALSITQSAKRMVAAMGAPFFRKCDLAALKKLAALARLAGVGDWPEEGWSISYQQIPLSPDEEKAQREQEDHDKSLGLVSTVDLWLRRHPGQTREEAILHLKRVRDEEALLSIPSSDPKQIQLTTTDIAGIITVDEARASQGLPPSGTPDGRLTVAEFQTKHASTLAAAVQATSGNLAVSPPEATSEEPTNSEESMSEEIPEEDSTSEEAESEALAQVAEELDALDELLPVDAEAADVDFPAIKATIANVRELLDLK